jgi:hypothetical protein
MRRSTTVGHNAIELVFVEGRSYHDHADMG